ncbi:MAG: DNA polymerase III subunit beta, partial [Thermodesulfobacteriaceae bacterium]|nr:DNA polymerase III subunit beta [Thermodesulfobacteriaceae bacterium]
GQLLIKEEQEKAIYKISTTSEEDFPSLPEFFDENLLEITVRVLSQLFEKTAFCASKDEARFVVGGIYVEPLLDEGKLRAVASDGHRLALYEVEVSDLKNSSLVESFIIGRKAVNLISEISEEELLVKFGFVNNYAVLFFSNGFFFSRTIEGTYPDYKSVIPTEFQNLLKVDKKLLSDAIKRAGLLISEKFKPIKFTLSSSSITLNSPETEWGSAEIKIPAEYQGTPLTVTFNADYLLSALDQMVSEEIEIKIIDEKAPALITGYRDEGFLYLLMPMVL